MKNRFNQDDYRILNVRKDSGPKAKKVMYLGEW